MPRSVIRGGLADGSGCTEMTHHPGERLPLREPVGLVLARLAADLDDAFGRLGRAHHAVEHRDAERGLEPVGEFRETRTAQADRLGVVLVAGAEAFLAQLFQRAFVIPLDVEHIDRRGAHDHPVAQAVARHHVLHRHAEARDDGDDGHPRRQLAGHVERGLGDPDHRLVRHLARSMQAGVAVASDDVGVESLPVALRDLVQDAGDAEIFVVEGFDRGRRVVGGDRRDLRALPRHRTGGHSVRLRHLLRRVGVDDHDLHDVFLPPGAAWRAAPPETVSPRQRPHQRRARISYARTACSIWASGQYSSV